MIVWNPSGFHLINALPKDCKFNANFGVTQVLGPLSVWRRTQLGRTNRKLIVHCDDARPHTARMALDFMERNAMERAPYPSYSPDMALSDFHLFGHVKHLLAGHEFANRDNLLEAGDHILSGIGKEILERVFPTWMERLLQCSTSDGEYVEQRILLYQDNLRIIAESWHGMPDTLSMRMAVAVTCILM
jgi:hypothetical protein